jgi:hypothetical protein
MFSLSSLSSQLKQLGSRIQETGRTLAATAGNAVELSSMGGAGAGSGSAAATAGSSGAATAAGAAAGVGAAAAIPSPKDSGGLEADPDLEAYLQASCMFCCTIQSL